MTDNIVATFLVLISISTGILHVLVISVKTIK